MFNYKMQFKMDNLNTIIYPEVVNMICSYLTPPTSPSHLTLPPHPPTSLLPPLQSLTHLYNTWYVNIYVSKLCK